MQSLSLVADAATNTFVMNYLVWPGTVVLVFGVVLLVLARTRRHKMPTLLKVLAALWLLMLLGVIAVAGQALGGNMRRVITYMALVVAFLVVGVVIHMLRVQRARKNELSTASGACVACHSRQTVVIGDVRRCWDCGYEGRVDGGGALKQSDVAGL